MCRLAFVVEDSQTHADSCSVHFSRRLAIRNVKVLGGDGRARTGDPLLAKQVLSQLSYIPSEDAETRVGLSGFEPETSRLSAVRSYQLS